MQITVTEMEDVYGICFCGLYTEMTRVLSQFPELYSRRMNSLITALKYLTEHLSME